MENARGTATMIESDANIAIDIQLEEDANGKERIAIKIPGQEPIALTSHQARILATELIMAANRAEVRENLKRNENLVRKNNRADTSRSGYHQAFAK